MRRRQIEEEIIQITLSSHNRGKNKQYSSLSAMITTNRIQFSTLYFYRNRVTALHQLHSLLRTNPDRSAAKDCFIHIGYLFCFVFRHLSKDSQPESHLSV